MDMKVDNSTSAYSASAANTSSKAPETSAKTDDVTAAKEKDAAAIYQKSKNSSKDSANKIYNRDAIVSKLKVDQESRMASMQSLVEKLLNKQKGTFDLANQTNLAATFREAASLASPEDILKAKQDVAEDGYWGVDKTSDRLVSMAIALSGGDTSKADELKEAIAKGFEKATKAWGEELPDICKNTLEAANKKMDDWKNGVTTAEDYSDYLS